MRSTGCCEETKPFLQAVRRPPFPKLWSMKFHLTNLKQIVKIKMMKKNKITYCLLATVSLPDSKSKMLLVAKSSLFPLIP